MRTHPTWPTFVVAFIGALGALVLLAPNSDATRAQSDAAQAHTVDHAPR